MPTPAPDLGGASPIWTLILLAIVVGPFTAGIIGIKNRRSGSPRDNGTVESLKDWIDVRTGGKGSKG